MFGWRFAGLIWLICIGGAAAQGIPTNIVWSPAITISQGGTYSGNWESQDPTKPAVLITTSDPVIIQNCYIRSMGNLIQTLNNYDQHQAANVTIRNCSGYALNPNIKGQQNGAFYASAETENLTFEHNFAEGVSCFVGLPQRVSRKTPWQPIIIRYNQQLNGISMPSDGKGGRDIPNPLLPSSNFASDGSEISGTMAFDGGNYYLGTNFQSSSTPYCGPQMNWASTTGSAGEIAWNEFINQPWASQVGDIIDLWHTSGTATTPITIHDNFIWGGYSIAPNLGFYQGGGITMDGGGDETIANATAFIKIYNNQVVAKTGVGIAVENGHDIEAYGNRVVASGQLFDGSWYQPYTRSIDVWHCVCGGAAANFFNNFAHDNLAGSNSYPTQYSAGGMQWLYYIQSSLTPQVAQFVNGVQQFSSSPNRTDYYFSDCQGGGSGNTDIASKLNLPATSKCTGNISLPDPITTATENDEFQLWQKKLVANGIQIGPQNATPQSGWWWNPSESGRNYSLEVSASNGTIFFAAYMFDADGSPVWYAATLVPQGGNVFQGDLTAYQGGQTLSGTYQPVGASVLSGTAKITFTSATTGWLSITGNGLTPIGIGIQRYHITANGLSAAPPILASGAPDPAFASHPPVSSLSVPATPTQPESGWWWNPAEPRSGYFIETQASTVLMAFYMYDANGKPIWYSSQNTLANDTTYTGTMVQYGNGQILGGAFKAASVVNANVGQVQINFFDPRNGLMTLPGGRQVSLTRFTAGATFPFVTAPIANGWWYNSNDVPGRGYSLEINNGRILLAAYMYRDDGSPVWYLADEVYNPPGFSGTLFDVTGTQTLGSTGAGTTAVGPTSLKISGIFSSSTQGSLTLSGGPLGSASKTIPITRFPIDSISVKTPSSTAAPQTGWWWNVNETGVGYFIEQQASQIFMANYLYGTDQRDRWYIALNSTLPMGANGETMTGSLLQVTGGQTLTSGPLTAMAGTVGQVTLTFTSPIAGTIILPTGRAVAITRFKSF